MTNGEDIDVTPFPELEGLLTPGAIAFIAELERRFRTRRAELLEARRERRELVAEGAVPGPPDLTEAIRSGTWQVAPLDSQPSSDAVELLESTDPAVALALATGNRLVICDLGPSTDWRSVLVGHSVARSALRRTPGRTAFFVLRPRGWDVDEENFVVDGQPASASLFDLGMAVYHNARQAILAGTGPFFDLPGIESHLEARLWNDIFCAAQDLLGIDRGRFKAIAPIENDFASYEPDEILYELREHSFGMRSSCEGVVDVMSLACERHGAPVFADIALAS